MVGQLGQPERSKGWFGFARDAWKGAKEQVAEKIGFPKDAVVESMTQMASRGAAFARDTELVRNAAPKLVGNALFDARTDILTDAKSATTALAEQLKSKNKEDSASQQEEEVYELLKQKFINPDKDNAFKILLKKVGLRILAAGYNIAAHITAVGLSHVIGIQSSDGFIKGEDSEGIFKSFANMLWGKKKNQTQSTTGTA